MKVSLIFKFVFLGLLIQACTPKASGPLITGDVNKGSDDELLEIVEEEEEEYVDIPEDPVEMVARFSRTGCYGTCPVFSVEFFSDGTAIYKGQQNVERKGTFKASPGKGWVQNIQAKAKHIGYFDFKAFYPDRKQFIVDFPNVITYVKYRKQEHKITNNHDAPGALLTFEKFLEDCIQELNWEKG